MRETGLDRFIKNEQSASILPESRLCNQELAALTSHMVFNNL